MGEPVVGKTAGADITSVQSRILLTEDGRLRMRKEPERWELFDFNAVYSGYYPACTFTAAVDTGEALYAAGTDDRACPRLFSSASGGVWSEVNLSAGLRERVPPSAYGAIVRLLPDDSSGMLFAVCRNGYLLTLTDCPKCLRARRLTSKEVRDGEIESGDVLLYCMDGESLRVPVKSVAEYRVSWSYALPYLKAGGVTADLRTTDQDMGIILPYSIRVKEHEIRKFLESQPRTRFLAFVCMNGLRADDAAEAARGLGYRRACSLGSIGHVLMDMQQ